MTKQVEIKAGDRYGRLVVLEEVAQHVYPSGQTRRRFLMKCDCGSPPKTFLISSFRNGTTLSCGCYNLEKCKSHGMHSTRQYQCWADMKTRCLNTNHKWYEAYGGRGITVCEKWLTFEGFWEDMKEGYSDDLTLNRRNNNASYCKENCAWDDAHFQGHMQRKLDGTIFKALGLCNTSGGKISANIKIKAERIYLGAYETEEEAVEAYDEASYKVYGDRPNNTASARPAVVERVSYYLANIHNTLRPKGSEMWNTNLTEQSVREIKDLYRSGLFTQKELAKEYAVLQCTVSSIVRGVSWKHVE